MEQVFSLLCVMGLKETTAMPSRRLSLVVGLGNPGADYAQTRHNAGFMVANELAEKFGLGFDKHKFDTVFGRGRIDRVPVVLAKPLAFMNRSGLPVKMLADFFKIPSEAVLVIHDDIDLAFGRLKIKEKGGHGGHNGIRSLIDAFGTDNFVRLRIGVGRSGPDRSVSDHVLGRFSELETEFLDRIITTARDAVAIILCHSTKTAMNQFNQKLI